MPNTTFRPRAAAAALALAAGLAGCGPSDQAAVNLYSARHYDIDKQLFAAFEESSGIKVNVIEADGDLLIEKVRAEGARSPADVIITVDAGRLWRAEQAGLFQPIESETVEAAVPAELRHPDGYWFGFATRARVIVYDRADVDPADVDTYANLADPMWRGRVCVRSSTNVYNVSLLAALVERWGADAARDWAQGVKDNFARDPQGGDTDQIRAIEAGVCDVALVNHYYYARLMQSEDPAVDSVGLLWPDQTGAGAHVNVTGAGLAVNAPHREEAIAFLEFLVSEEAQRILAEGATEFPVSVDAMADSAILERLGDFEAEPVNVSVFGENQAEAARIFDQVGWP